MYLYRNVVTLIAVDYYVYYFTVISVISVIFIWLSLWLISNVLVSINEVTCMLYPISTVMDGDHL